MYFKKFGLTNDLSRRISMKRLLLLLLSLSLLLFVSCGGEEDVNEDVDGSEGVENVESSGLVDKGDYYLFGGDMKLYKEDPNHKLLIDSILGKEGITHRGVKKLITPLWPGGIVTYRFEDLSKSEKKAVRDAMDKLEKIAGVKFIENSTVGVYKIWKSNDTADGKLGASTVGYSDYANYEFISKEEGTILHELLHGLGFSHEHQRPDRDKYIKVLYKNIIKSAHHNFKKLNGDVVTHGKYDYDSIMHYTAAAASKNNSITIETIDPKYQNKIGQHDKLSKSDKGSDELYWSRS